MGLQLGGGGGLYIHLTISDFPNSVVNPSCYILVSLSLCVSLVCFCAILLTCNLFSFNTDVNWLPGSASPYGYSRQLVL